VHEMGVRGIKTRQKKGKKEPAKDGDREVLSKGRWVTSLRSRGGLPKETGTTQTRNKEKIQKKGERKDQLTSHSRGIGTEKGSKSTNTPLLKKRGWNCRTRRPTTPKEAQSASRKTPPQGVCEKGGKKTIWGVKERGGKGANETIVPRWGHRGTTLRGKGGVGVTGRKRKIAQKGGGGHSSAVWGVGKIACCMG